MRFAILLTFHVAPAFAQEPPPPPPPGPAPAAPADEPPPARVYYKKGFVMQSGDFELKAGIRSQTRIEVNRLKASDELEAHFVIPRLRLQLEGYAFGEANTYKVEFDMANRGYSLLKDFYVNHEFHPAIHLRVGQWKRPFNRQEMVSDFGSEFLERSITNEFGGGGRDLGVAVHNDYEKSPDGIEWALGLFNSTGDRPTQTITCEPAMDPTMPPICTTRLPTNIPTDFGPMVVVRVGFNYGGIKGYSEGDLEGGPFRLAVGASYKINLRDFEEDAMGDKLTNHAAEADVMIKVEGFDLTGAFFAVKDGSSDVETGLYAQAGYFVLPEVLELCGRYGQIPEGDVTIREMLLAVDWYFDGHSFKWMTDGGIIRTTGDPATNDVQIRTQLQAVF